LSARGAAQIATLICVAFAAYLAADVAHEALGHGGGCLLFGGHPIFVSTTTEFCSIRLNAIDTAGPVAGIIVALLAFAWLSLRPPRNASLRAFLSLTFAFAIFWNVGYMMKSGLTDEGDWASTIAGLEPSGVWHIGLTALGFVLYVAAMRLLGVTLRKKLAAEVGVTPFAFALTAYLAAALLSVLGALFDPRGPHTILSDALPSSLGAIGLPWVGLVLNRRYPALRLAVPVSLAWIAIGLVSATIFIAVLGPGFYF
jgi:hypothetical protein